MDNTRLDEQSVGSAAGLEGLYTNFDGWVTRFTASHQKLTCFSQETSTMEDSRNNDNLHNGDLNEHFFRNILMRQRKIQHSVKKPCFSVYKENEGFIFYDHIFYALANKNGDSRIYCQLIRSKL